MTNCHYHWLRTHACPHLDEIVAVLTLREWFKDKAEDAFPGSSTAKIKYFKLGVLPEGKTAADYRRHLFVGCGKDSVLDEHHATAEKRHECAATLVAYHLGGIMEVPHLRTFFEEVRRHDRDGDENHLHIGRILKLMYHMEQPPSLEELFQWVNVACKAEMSALGMGVEAPGALLSIDRIHHLMSESDRASADKWIGLAVRAQAEADVRRHDAQAHIKSLKRNVKRIGTENGTARLLEVADGNDMLPGAAWRSGIDVLVHHHHPRNRGFTGTMQIMTRTEKDNTGLCLRRVAAQVRSEEMVLRGAAYEGNVHKLCAIDIMSGVPEWHLVNMGDKKPCSMLFNGSLTAPHARSTRIPLGDITSLVEAGLS